jgi:hypothetical protein
VVTPGVIHSDFQPEIGSISLWITPALAPRGDPQRFTSGNRL